MVKNKNQSMEKDLVLIEKKITENIQREKAHKLESLLCFEKMKSKVLVFETKINTLKDLNLEI